MATNLWRTEFEARKHIRTSRITAWAFLIGAILVIGSIALLMWFNFFPAEEDQIAGHMLTQPHVAKSLWRDNLIAFSFAAFSLIFMVFGALSFKEFLFLSREQKTHLAQQLLKREV